VVAYQKCAAKPAPDAGHVPEDLEGQGVRRTSGGRNAPGATWGPDAGSEGRKAPAATWGPDAGSGGREAPAATWGPDAGSEGRKAPAATWGPDAGSEGRKAPAATWGLRRLDGSSRRPEAPGWIKPKA